MSYLRNIREQVRKAFCCQKLFWPFTVLTNYSSDLKRSFSPSLKQFFLTVGQTNFLVTKYQFCLLFTVWIPILIVAVISKSLKILNFSKVFYGYLNNFSHSRAEQFWNKIPMQFLFFFIINFQRPFIWYQLQPNMPMTPWNASKSSKNSWKFKKALGAPWTWLALPGNFSRREKWSRSQLAVETTKIDTYFWYVFSTFQANPLLICTWFLKNQFGKIKFNELDF